MNTTVTPNLKCNYRLDKANSVRVTNESEASVEINAVVLQTVTKEIIIKYTNTFAENLITFPEQFKLCNVFFIYINIDFFGKVMC